jgi:nucleoside-diphosphate-sugar epimerase
MVTTVFITGATGNIGGKIIGHILQQDTQTELVLLVRDHSNSKAGRRFEDVLRTLYPEIDGVEAKRRIRVVCGDITVAGLGLPQSTLEELAMRVTHIIHAAATTQFQLPWREAHLVNYAGTRNVMAFAKQAWQIGRLKGIAHISTAYVCGKREGRIYEEETWSCRRFSNSYEQTKWEAEEFVRSLMSELPVTIFRPSVVVGDSQTGRMISFNVLSPPLRWIQKGIVTAFPCQPDNPLDIVPVDFVSLAIHHILLKREPCPGKTYHIVAGAEKSVTVGEVIGRAVSYFNSAPTGPSPVRVKFGTSHAQHATSPQITGRERRGLQLVKVYEPYICATRHFDNTQTLEALRGTGISVPRFSSYFDNILRYSFPTDWGKRVKEAA